MITCPYLTDMELLKWQCLSWLSILRALLLSQAHGALIYFWRNRSIVKMRRGYTESKLQPSMMPRESLNKNSGSTIIRLTGSALLETSINGEMINSFCQGTRMASGAEPEKWLLSLLKIPTNTNSSSMERNGPITKSCLNKQTQMGIKTTSFRLNLCFKPQRRDWGL